MSATPSAPLRVGVLGLSPGNGHPFSWSAICNGYAREAMAECGFPAIPAYLAKQSWPQAQTEMARVTHVWTQSRDVSRSISDACFIEHIVDVASDMIGEVDAVLLARDDAENHFELAAPFLEAGLPVYIDKPIATSRQDLRRLLNARRFAGQIFSCSALVSAEELRLDGEARIRLGAIKHVLGETPLQWEKYAIHAIEPLLAILEPTWPIIHSESRRFGEIVSLDLAWSCGKTASIRCTGAISAPISLRLYGETTCETRVFSGFFPAFKRTLEDFFDCAAGHRPPPSDMHLERVVEVIEKGVQP